MISFFKKYKSRLFMIWVAAALTAFSYLMLQSAKQIGLKADVKSEETLPRVVIDAGHGGEDGGAVVGNVLEKDINLSISRDTEDLLRFFGYEVTMTRRDDSSLSDEGDSVKKRKYNDMQKRLKLYNSHSDNTVISIHQNKFSAASSKGTQVFYSPNNEQSKALAERIQFAVKTTLQPQNTREPKAAGKNIYLLKNTTQPAVIVECGFISNKEECKMLLSEEYQREMALSITTGFLDFQRM